MQKIKQYGLLTHATGIKAVTYKTQYSSQKKITKMKNILQIGVHKDYLASGEPLHSHYVSTAEPILTKFDTGIDNVHHGDKT